MIFLVSVIYLSVKKFKKSVDVVLK